MTIIEKYRIFLTFIYFLDRDENVEIYLITNLVNEKQYVGQTIYTKEQRWCGHINGTLCVDRAISKYKPENFRLETLEIIEKEEDLDAREQYWIKKLNTLVPNGYNILPGGNCHAGASVSYDIEKYLYRMFYPLSNLNNGIRVKVYLCDPDKFYDVIDDIVHFEDMYNTNLKMWFDWQRNFYKKASTLVNEDSIKEIAYKTLFFPSLRFLSNNQPSECHRNLYVGLIQDCLVNNQVLDCRNFETSEPCGCVAYFSTNVDQNEYDNYVTNTINEMLNDYAQHPMKLKEFLKYEKYFKIIKHRSNIQKIEQKRTRVYNNKLKWLKHNTSSCKLRSYKNNHKINVVFNQEEKEFTDKCIDNAVHNACVWVLHMMGRETDDINLICADNRQKKPVIQYTKSGVFVQKYSSMAEAERITGIKASGISRCCNFKIVSFCEFLWCFDIDGHEKAIQSKLKELQKIEEKRKQNKELYNNQYKYKKRKNNLRKPKKTTVDRNGKRPMGRNYKTE